MVAAAVTAISILLKAKGMQTPYCRDHDTSLFLEVVCTVRELGGTIAAGFPLAWQHTGPSGGIW